MNFSRRKLIEDRDTILEFTAKIQELQNEVNWMNDSRDFKDAESVRKKQVKSSHQLSPSSVKFEDRSQEETERQERCAGGDAWKLAQHIFYLKETKNYILFAFR